MGRRMTRIALFAALLLFVPMGAAQGASVNLDVSLIKSEPVPLQTGEYADVWVKVRNTGDTTSRDTVVGFRETFPFSTDHDERTTWRIGDISPGTEHYIHMQVRVDENAVHGTNHLVFNLSNANSGIVIEEEVPIEVRTDDAALVVQNITFPERVGPGTTHTMEVTVANLADSTLKNIDVGIDFSDADLPFATTGTSSERISAMAPGASRTIQFRVHADEDAENGVYKAPFTLDYEDEAGTAFGREELTGFVVGGEVSLSVGVQERDLMQAGNTGRITLRLVNRGEGQARFVSLSVGADQGYEIISADSVYLGNMEADDYQTAEFRVYADDSLDDLRLPVTITYRDTAGDPAELTRTVSVPLYDATEMKRFNLDGRSTPWLFVLIVAVVIVGAGYWWRRR